MLRSPPSSKISKKLGFNNIEHQLWCAEKDKKDLKRKSKWWSIVHKGETFILDDTLVNVEQQNEHSELGQQTSRCTNLCWIDCNVVMSTNVNTGFMFDYRIWNIKTVGELHNNVCCCKCSKLFWCGRGQVSSTPC